MSFTSNMTIRELFNELCAIASPQDAAEFWHGYVQYLDRPEADLNGGAPEAVAASNIGYVMGYGTPEQRERVYGLFSAFNVSHPVFGRSEPTASEAFAAGRRRGEPVS